MIRLQLVSLAISLLLLSGGRFSVTADELSLPSPETVFNGLRTDHPRLLATAADFARLKAQCATSRQAAAWNQHLRKTAEQLLTKETLKYHLPDGKRLLSVSRAAKDRVLLLGLVYRLTRDDRFAKRLWTELDTVTRFPDWNPKHFLDTAEMTFAVAIGYDWLYDVWDLRQRRQLREAIAAKGLSEGLSVYRRQQWWTRSIHNWNQVCNGGMAVGAIAIADDEPKLAAEVLHAALHSLPLAMHEFRPDGGWGEGPGYWRYATEYNVYLLAALNTALATDFGLSNLPGFSRTGDFPIHFTGPTGRTFNYADAHDSWHGAPQLFWLARRFNRSDFAIAQMPYATKHPTPLDLLWGVHYLTRTVKRGPVPLDRHFVGVSVVTMRSAWNDPLALFVGFKGGDNRVNHGHLDLGTFVLESGGVRWAVDLGPDDYNIPGYFGKQRWTYYRTMTEGHNTLVVNHKNQSTSATASIIRFASSSDGVCAVADLSKAYPDAQRVWRGVRLVDRRHVIVRDELEASSPIDVTWQLHTHSTVIVDGRRATLTDGRRHLYATIMEPASAHFHVQSVSLTPPQRPLKKVQRLSISLPAPTNKLNLVVLLTADVHVANDRLNDIGSLDNWPHQPESQTGSRLITDP